MLMLSFFFGGPHSQNHFPILSLKQGEWSGYSLQVLTPFAFAQAVVGFPLLSLPEPSA
jgi:hypothetical protein